uniref:Armadillo repeat-containing domain-containing protein n=1 Tax=Octopus bimaculoides TaxID=37653 RepID=A0A0L8GRU8_OCTBM|eukprot:XP_014778891.1 PREDICTED: armadillo repeat-containing protein 7-like [Octopus bimaculoides]
MFSSEEYLRKKTGEYGIGRLSYLQSLVTEFEETTSDDAKKEILANLANFGYDPLNYGFFRQLNILDLFLDSLEDNDEKMVEFAIAGLCNCCLGKASYSSSSCFHSDAHYSRTGHAGVLLPRLLVTHIDLESYRILTCIRNPFFAKN